jgi:hypothetical protein
MQLVELGIRAMLGGVFAIDAAGKLRSRAAFDSFVDSIPTLPGVTRDRLVAIAATVVALELAAVMLLIVRPLAGLGAATGLLAAFTVVMIVTLRAGTAMVYVHRNLGMPQLNETQAKFERSADSLHDSVAARFSGFVARLTR